MEKKKPIEKLVKKAMKGSDEAFEKLLEMKSDIILFTSSKILGNYHDAEDVAQEVVMRMYDNIGKLKDPSSFNAWMNRIIINQCYTLGKKKSAKPEVTGADDMIDEIIEDDKEFLPYHYIESKEQRIRIREIINSLPPDRQLVVSMYFYEGMTYQEISHAMDKSKGHIASDLKRAKDSIKAELEKDPDFKNMKVDKNAATPVLSVVMSEYIKEEVPRESIDKLISFTHSKVLGSSATHASASSSTKLISALAVSTLVATGGIAYAANNIYDTNSINDAPTSAGIEMPKDPDNVEGEIAYSGKLKGKEHINPESISLKNVNDDYTGASWEINGEALDQPISGEGTEITGEVQALHTQKLDGKYNVVFNVEYPYGDLEVTNDFYINSNK